MAIIIKDIKKLYFNVSRQQSVVIEKLPRQNFKYL